MTHKFEIRLRRTIPVRSGHFGTLVESFCWTTAMGTFAREAMDHAENRFPGWKAITWNIIT